MGDVGTGIDDTLPLGLADADRETEGCGQQMVAEAVGSAHAVEVLHGGRVADFGGEGKAAGEVVLGLDAVGNSEGLVGIVLVVEDADADEGNEAPSGEGMDVFLVLRAKDVPEEVGTEVLVMLRAVGAVGELGTAVGDATTYGGCEPLAECDGECRTHAAKEVVAAERGAQEGGGGCGRLEEPVGGPGGGD